MINVIVELKPVGGIIVSPLEAQVQDADIVNTSAGPLLRLIIDDCSTVFIPFSDIKYWKVIKEEVFVREGVVDG